jgi:hypothetical protein
VVDTNSKIVLSYIRLKLPPTALEFSVIETETVAKSPLLALALVDIFKNGIVLSIIV